MSFGGPIDSMFNSNKSNLRQLRKRKSLKDIQNQYGSSKKTIQTSSQLTTSQQQEIAKQIDQMKIRRRTARIVSAVVTLIIFVLMAIVLMMADISGILDIIN